MVSVSSPDTVAIRLLGGVEFSPSEGRGLPRKGWALLAYLAAEPGAAQPRDRLAEILWPSLPPDAARSNLRQVLLGLQRTAGGIPGLAADRHAIRLDDAAPAAVDLAAFLRDVPECADAGGEGCRACLARVEAMADLYRGEFMAGFTLPDCPDFEDWLLVQREALLRRALILLERLSLCHERLGNPDRALAFAQRAVDLDPWNEEGQRRLMRLLALNGLRGAALTQYEACRRMLEQELGVQPDAETQTLARCLREGGAPPAAEAAAEAPALTVERRQVTVLCCQVSPAESLDPEDAMDLLRAPQTRCIHIVRQFHGHVVRTNDGGFLAYFGYPQAHEHAARLAVRAGLALAAEGFPRVCLRIGIHTGEIITGADPNLPDTIGKTSAMAVRLRSWAGPGEVVLGAATQRLVAGYFVCAALAGAETGDAFLALRESGALSRLQAAAAVAPLAGRAAETGTLRGLWRAARSGRRQALLLSGDAGIGKSRLVHALKQDLAEETCLIREAQCLPEFGQTPFHPAAALLKSRLAAAPGDTPETLFRKLADYLASRFPHIDLGEAAPLFAGMLSLPVAAPYRVPGISLQAQREKVMGFLIEQVRSVAAGVPMLLVVEDLHWSDPTTLDLLSRILAATADLPLFLLCTARPGFRAPWPEAAMPELRLRPLAEDGIRAVISALRPGLPDAAVRRIVARADGIPLFAEELARAASGAAEPGIPSSLMDLLAARLDDMGAAKSTAQLAATIGRDVPMALLRALSPLAEEGLAEALARLRAEGILVEDGEGTLQFRHALFQDAAYRMQTKADRRAAHRRIAEVLENGFPEAARSHPENMARHWTAAGETETAIAYRLLAGRRANAQCAHQEAISHFSAGLALAAELPEGQRRVQREFDLQAGLGAAHFAAEGYGSPGGGDAYARAVALGERHADKPDLFPALWGLWACTSSRADYDESLALTQRLLRMAQRSRDPVQEQQGHFAVGNIRFWRGELAEARRHLECAMAAYAPEHHARFVDEFGENAYVTSGSYLAWTLCLSGLPDRAVQVCRDTLAEARRIDHPFSLGYGLTLAGALELFLRRPREVLTLAGETVALARRHTYPLWEAGGTLEEGWAMVHLGRPEGMDRIRAAVASVPTLMSGIRLIFLQTMADALCLLGVFDEAMAVLAEARDVVDRLNDRHAEAEIHRLEGECRLGRDGDAAAAEACFRHALAVSRKQQARLLELRAAASLARLWRATGREDAAKKLLAESLAGFSAQGDFPDIAEARRLLADLTQR